MRATTAVLPKRRARTAGRHLARLMIMMTTFARLLMVGLLAVGCAAGPRPRPETAARIKDSPSEKVAAHRAASPSLGLEREDERWGFDAARDRRRAADQRKK
jgi:hypothetical protein